MVDRTLKSYYYYYPYVCVCVRACVRAEEGAGGAG